MMLDSTDRVIKNQKMANEMNRFLLKRETAKTTIRQRKKKRRALEAERGF